MPDLYLFLLCYRFPKIYIPLFDFFSLYFGIDVQYIVQFLFKIHKFKASMRNQFIDLQGSTLVK